MRKTIGLSKFLPKETLDEVGLLHGHAGTGKQLHLYRPQLMLLLLLLLLYLILWLLWRLGSLRAWNEIYGHVSP
jgi:hypothetical protein